MKRSGLSPSSTSSSPRKPQHSPPLLSLKPKRETFVTGAHSRICDAMTSSVRKVSGYRLYCLDGVNKVASAEWIEADEDEAAIEIAKERQDGYECEVWQSSRLVARLDLRRKA